MDDIVDPAKLEAEFQAAMASPEDQFRLIMTALNLTNHETQTDVFTITGVATPTPTKTVLVALDPETGEEFKITVEELKNNGG